MNLKLIKAKYLFLCDEKFTILCDKGVVFDTHFREVGDFDALQKKYPSAKLIKTPENSLILPAFINTHTHLEFSANAYTLHYGDFLLWLKSVMNSRSALSEQAREGLILGVLKQMLKSGTGTIGEISSFGGDLSACVKSPMRVVFFNELLGVNENQNATKKAEFLKRFSKSAEFKSDFFIPAVSLHSTYSVNRGLAEFLVDFARKQNLLISTHFLESNHENSWLRGGKGGFKKWLKFADSNPRAHFGVADFVGLFRGARTLFTHCVYVKPHEFTLFDKNLHSITHCAFSNRLLSRKKLDLKALLQSKLNAHLGTDGLSSNVSLSMLDEMRANLLLHSEFKDLAGLAKTLLLMATSRPAKALNLNLGEIKVGKIADFSVFEIGDLLTNAENSVSKVKISPNSIQNSSPQSSNSAKNSKISAKNSQNSANLSEISNSKTKNSPNFSQNSAQISKIQAQNAENSAQLPLQFILNAKFAKKLFIEGKECEI